MKKIAQLVLATIAMSMAQAQVTAQNSYPLGEARKAIAESNTIYFTSFAKNQASIFADRYAEDACIMASNAPAQCGREAALNFFKDGYENYGIRDGKFVTINVFGDGKEYATEEGLWQLFDANGKMLDDGKFLVLWKKTKSGWKMYRDSFSSNHRNTK